MRRHTIFLALAAACGALGGCEVSPPYAGSLPGYGAPYRPYAAPAYPPGHSVAPGYRSEYGRPEYGRPEHGRPEYGQREDGRSAPPLYGSPPAYRPDYAPPEYRQPGPWGAPNERRGDDGPDLGPRTWR